MLAVDDVARSVRGSWRLMSHGSEALPELDLSREGFWNSFAAFVLLLPAAIAFLAAARLDAGLSNASGLFDAPLLTILVFAAQPLTILAIPALIAALAPGQWRTPRFTSFVIAWNWAGIVSVGMMALPATVFALGWSNHELATLQYFAFTLIVLRLRYGVARAVFGADGRVAVLVVLASLITDYGVASLLGLAPF